MNSRETTTKAPRSSSRMGILVAALIMAFAMVAAGCGSSKSSGGGSSSTGSKAGGGTSSAKEITVGVSMIGPRNDRAFSQEHYLGVKQASQEVPGVKMGPVLENRASPQQRTDAVKTLATSGSDVVVLGSATFAPIVDQLADRYPNVYFITTSAFPAHFHKNVTAIVHDQGQASYAAGAVQGKLTKSGTLGYVGSLEIPSDVGGEAGWEAGAKAENPKVKFLADRTGDFNDSAKAKDIATAELQQGADQLYGFVDAAIAGVYQAGKAAKPVPGLTDITYHGCETTDYPAVVGVTQSDYQRIILDALKAYQAGKLKPGAVLLGVEHPEYMDFVLCPKYKAMADISATRDKAIKDIISGAVKLPKAALVPSPGYPVRRQM